MINDLRSSMFKKHNNDIQYDNRINFPSQIKDRYWSEEIGFGRRLSLFKNLLII